MLTNIIFHILPLSDITTFTAYVHACLRP